MSHRGRRRNPAHRRSYGMLTTGPAAEKSLQTINKQQITNELMKSEREKKLTKKRKERQREKKRNIKKRKREKNETRV